MIQSTDHHFMQKAIMLAKKGEFTARPNPCVGAILVKDEVVLAEGCHWQAGLPHAEQEALLQAKAKGLDVSGATCYVSLEPCAHEGKTAPCTQALIDAKIDRVVIGCLDPNPLVSGRGVRALTDAGMTVVNLDREDAKNLNRGFFSRMTRKRPWVRGKMAMSLDGRTAMKSGESQWITNETSRKDAHQFRARSGAILTSAKTVLADNARLTVRKGLSDFPSNVIFKQPLRIILDQHLSLPPEQSILHEPGEVWILINNAQSADKQATFLNRVNNSNVKCIVFPQGEHQHLDISPLWSLLAQYEINDVLIEAGPTLVGGLLKSGCIDEMLVYIAPKFLGHEGYPMLVIPELMQLKEHIAGQFQEAVTLESDLRLQMML